MAKEKKQKEAKPEKRKKTNAEKKSIRAKRIKFLKVSLLATSIGLIILYLVLKILYSPGDFTIILGNDFSRDKGLIMYESIVDKREKKILAAPSVESMDNISVDWIPSDINNERDGSHNGDNYLAYTFYIEHLGIETLNYWYSIYIDDVFKNIDEAIRIMVFLNGEKTVYAKPNGSGNSERDTTPFYGEGRALLEERKLIQPGDIDKFTIVIWIEGDDPDCVDALIRWYHQNAHGNY